MHPRRLTPRLLEALADTPVVLLHGPRQCGKSTLVQRLAGGDLGARYVTLDAMVPRAAATHDPETFLRELGRPAVIDEVQRVPQLFHAIKLAVDTDRRPGQLLLTGSADIALMPAISESLAGRVERLTLWPLAQCELAGTSGNLVDMLFASAPPRTSGLLGRQDYLALAIRGGFPEAVSRAAGRRRGRWFASYLDTMVERDVPQLADIDGVITLPRLLAALADRAGGLVNVADLARDLDMNRLTVKKYTTLLQMAFLTRELPAWHRSVGARLRKAPKIIFPDSGLLAHLLGADDARSAAAERRAGALIENLVVSEVMKLMSWADTEAHAHHLRTEDDVEVDLVLEARDGRLVGIEVKAAASIEARDLRGLRRLQALVGDDLMAGVILHSGSEAVAFGERLYALPISALWSEVGAGCAAVTGE